MNRGLLEYSQSVHIYITLVLFTYEMTHEDRSTYCCCLMKESSRLVDKSVSLAYVTIDTVENL